MEGSDGSLIRECKAYATHSESFTDDITTRYVESLETAKAKAAKAAEAKTAAITGNEPSSEMDEKAKKAVIAAR